VQRAKENYYIAAELDSVYTMLQLVQFLDKTDAQRFVWHGKAALATKAPATIISFLNKMKKQIRNRMWCSQSGERSKGKLTLISQESLESTTILTLSASLPQIRLFNFTPFNCNHTERQPTLGVLSH
jgi:Cys-tRNA synthase (O-phospho-L-seryl-tRNA:Cys-tRNA synthase)